MRTRVVGTLRWDPWSRPWPVQRVLDLDELVSAGFLLGLLAVAISSSGSASWVSTTLTPISLNIARMSSICSELTSSEGSTELIWSWVT